MRVTPVILAVLASAALAACSHATGSSSLPSTFGPTLAARPMAGGFTSLYSFKGLPDGMSPAAGMVVLNGTLYGTTEAGGKADSGTVFTTTAAGKERVLYSFGSAGLDAIFPVAGLVVLGGALYGTGSAGGEHGFGGVFKVDKSGKEALLYSFSGSSDGADPSAALVADKGALYGTTLEGGGGTSCPQGCGTVFEVTAAGKEHVVYSFKGGSDGAGPLGNLIVVHSELYGTTASGGKNGVGTIFKTSVAGKEQVLHSFGSGNDGAEPEAGLVELGSKLYGTTNGAGKNFNGTAFVTTIAGGEHVLYSFKGGSDGASPEANLVVLKGNLYGTTAGGGTPNTEPFFP